MAVRGGGGWLALEALSARPTQGMYGWQLVRGGEGGAGGGCRAPFPTHFRPVRAYAIEAEGGGEHTGPITRASCVLPDWYRRDACRQRAIDSTSGRHSASLSVEDTLATIVKSAFMRCASHVVRSEWVEGGGEGK